MSAPGIPLAEVFEAANSLRSAGLIADYALGGALAAVRYTEPFTTYDADVFFIPADTGQSAGIPQIYAHLEKLNHTFEREHTIIRGFPVQWLATHGLTEEAVREALPIEFDGVAGRVFRVEYLVAIASLSPHDDRRNAKTTRQPSLRRKTSARGAAHRIFPAIQSGEPAKCPAIGAGYA